MKSVLVTITMFLLAFTSGAFGASVTTTQVVSDIEQADGRRYVEYRFDLLDNNNGNHVEYIGPKLVEAAFDTDADMLALIPVVLASKSDQEVYTIRAALSNGQDPFHIDMGGWWDKAIPDWNTWDDLFVTTAKYYWSLTYHLDILPFKDPWGRVSSTDKRDALGITNQTVSDMNADMQTAADTAASLEAYLPYFDEDGNAL